MAFSPEEGLVCCSSPLWASCRVVISWRRIWREFFVLAAVPHPGVTWLPGGALQVLQWATVCAGTTWDVGQWQKSVLCLLVPKNLQKPSAGLLSCRTWWKALLKGLRIKHVRLCRVVFVSSSSYVVFKSGGCFRVISDVMISKGIQSTCKSLGNENFI